VPSDDNVTAVATVSPPTREQLINQLYEAAELEHNSMCTYLYAVFSVKVGSPLPITS
jgi:hypothetical protein